MPRPLRHRPGPARRPLDAALGAAARVAVLRVLAAGGDPISGRELARRAGVQLRSAQLALEALVALGLARVLEGGRDRLVSLNTQHRLAGALQSLFTIEADLFRQLRTAVATALDREPPGRGVLHVGLFGSAARGDDSPGSDVDVLLVTRDEASRTTGLDRLLAAAPAIERETGSRLRPVAYTVRAARGAWRSRRPPFDAVRRDTVPLIGPPLFELLAR